MNVGQLTDAVLHEMREYSNSGTVVSEANNKDYLLSLIPMINTYQLELSIDTHKIKDIYSISQNMPSNMLQDFIEDGVHSTEDISYSVQGAKCYSFEVNGDATIYIEEEINGVWTTLSTISHTQTDTGFSEYQGYTNIGDTENLLRIRFSGSYRYLYRWVALFLDSYPNESDVPHYAPYVKYDLPTNLYQMFKVDATYANEQYSNINDFRIEIYDNSKKRIYFKWEDVGEFNIHYYKRPTLIEETDPNDIRANDLVELDIADEAFPALVHRISSALLKDENAYMSDSFKYDYNLTKEITKSEDIVEQSRQSVVSNTNW